MWKRSHVLLSTLEWIVAVFTAKLLFLPLTKLTTLWIGYVDVFFKAQMTHTENIPAYRGFNIEKKRKLDGELLIDHSTPNDVCYAFSYIFLGMYLSIVDPSRGITGLRRLGRQCGSMTGGLNAVSISSNPPTGNLEFFSYHNVGRRLVSVLFLCAA